MITPQQAIERLISNNELFYDEMTDLMRQIMSGQVPPEQIAAILTRMAIKEIETVSESPPPQPSCANLPPKCRWKNSDDPRRILSVRAGTVQNLQYFHDFDVCRNGMAKVAKHGGRSVSSSSGAARDGEMGAVVEHYAGTSRRKHPSNRLGLMLAQTTTKAMRHVAPVRRSLRLKKYFQYLRPAD